MVGGAAALALGGCASLDSFSGRMNTYATETERTQDQSIMLNVLRAADYRPMSFNEIQTISSTVTPSAMLSLNAPLSQNGSMTPTTLTPTVGFSGGPTVQASYLGAQEFYRGILTPVSMKTIDLLIQRRIPSTVLFNLLISRIIVRQIPNSEAEGPGKLKGAPEVFTAVNGLPQSGANVAPFQDLVEALVNDGLTTGPGKAEDTAFGPLLTDFDLDGADPIAKAARAGLEVRAVDWCSMSGPEARSLRRRRRFDLPGLKAAIKNDCAVIEAASTHPEKEKSEIDAARERVDSAAANAGAPAAYRLVKPGGPADPRFCMAAGRSADGANGVRPGICQIDASPTPSSTAADNKLKVVNGDPRLCQALNLAARSGGPLACDADWIGNGLELYLELRSTYSVIYFLGEIERRERAGGSPLLVKIGNPMAAIPAGVCSHAGQEVKNAYDTEGSAAGGDAYSCRILFYLARTHGRTADYLSVTYDGARYAAPDDELVAGKTNEVLDIVNELIALNHSAKDAPASSLVTVTGVR
jgi:hypothetical protein